MSGRSAWGHAGAQGSSADARTGGLHPTPTCSLTKESCISVQRALLAIGFFGSMAVEASAQTNLAMYEVGLGVQVGVPTSWVLTNTEELIAILERSPPTFRQPTLEAFREAAANGEDALLFRANDPSVPSNSTQMNVSVAPAMRIDAFLREEDIEAVVSHVCEGFADQAEAYGGIGECVWHETEIIENRPVLILEQDALVPGSAIDIVRTVAMFPSRGLLLTLAVSLSRSTFDLRLVRDILDAVQLPGDM